MMRQFTVLPPPLITDIQRTNDDIQIEFQVTPNWFNQLESIDDLATGSWIPMTNEVPITNTTVIVTDPGAAASVPQRYYRISLTPEPATQ